MRRREDDENESSMLRDGETRRIPLMMKDSTDARRGDMQRQFHRLHNGRGGTPGRRRGFAFSDARSDERERAYADYEKNIGEAWRRDAVGAPSKPNAPRELTIDQIYAQYDRDLEGRPRAR
jgi:hypothetical protein